MREKIKDKGRLEHILNAINTLLTYKDRYHFEDIKDDPIVFFGFVKHVEIIGEAVYMLTKEFRAQHPEIGEYASCPCTWLLHHKTTTGMGHDRN